MSNFGGQKPGAWNRPPGQMQGFPGVNVGGFSMMGVGVPMGMVNQAAFSQPNLLGMAGLVGGVQQAPLGQQVRPPAPVVPQNNQNMNGQQGKSHRTFVGTVTKMLDNYGFVDDDIFFQLGVISGAQPRVGEKVMVQASFNPNMPFKWNAHKISLIGNNVPIPQDAGRIEPPQHTSRWGAPSGHNERDRERSPSVRSSPPRHRRPSPRRSPPRKTSPKRERRRSPAPRARSPRRSPIRDNRKRDREKSPIHKDKVSSVRKASSSPPRRRARIIPRYEFRNIKEIPVHSLLTSNAVRLRYSKLYIPSDFVDLNLDWITGMPLESNTSFSNSIQFHVLHKDVEIPSGIDDELPPLEPDDADSRHQVKVLLLSHAGDVEILKKAFCLQPDGSTDENEEPQSFLKNLHFLTGTRGKEMMPIGGCWSPSLDGEDPESPVTLIKTAIRTTRAMTGVDLSLIPQWYSLARVRYYRSDKTRMDTVHLLFPDTQLLAPDDESWVALQQMIADQLKQKLAEVDALCLPPEEPEPTPETTTTIPVVTKDGTQTEDKTEVILLDDNKSGEAILLVEKVEEAKEQLAEAKTEETANAAVDDAAADKKEETAADVEMKNDEVVEDEASLDASMNESDIDKVLVHWSKIDVKMLKVTELRKQLEERKLETKGIKSLLVQRLQTALDAEKKKEEEKEVPVVAEVTENKEEEVTEVMEVQEDDIQVLEVIEKPEKSATELRNEENERKKKEVERKQKEEKLEKEKKEKREALERHYKLPTDKKILVFPSKVAKSGKFDCKVVSIDTLLGYRIDDNKEHSFEVAIYVEAIREFFERKFAFNIYRSIANSADKDSEKAKREEAAKKPKVIEVVDLEADEPVTVTPAEAAAATTTTPTTPPAAVVAPAASTESPEVKPLVDVKFEKIELKSVVHDRVLYMSFAYYDSSLTGYLLEKDVEALLGAAEFGLTRALIQKTLKKQSTRDKINYRNLTDVLQDSDGLVRYTPGVAEEIVADETLVRGYGIKLLESTEKPASSDKTAVQDASDGNVIVNGSIVNVPLKLKLLQSAETERDAIKSKLNEMQSLIEQLRESKSDMEKKKNQAEKDYEKTKKKLSETTASLKTAKEEVDTLKSAVSDFRKYATRILSIADKVDPPPKPASPVKEKVEKESKVEEVIMLDEIEDEPSAKTDETRKKEKSTEAPVVEASKPAEKEDDVIMLDTEEKTDA